MNYQNEKLTRLARGQPCMFHLEGICNNNPETTVWAHSNWQEHGKGYGLKAHDCFGAFSCSACHDYIDVQSRRIGIPTEARKAIWRSAADATLLFLWRDGLIKVA